MTVQLTVPMPEELRHQLHCLARARGWQFQTLIRHILQSEVNASIGDVAVGATKLELENKSRKDQS